MIVNCLENPIQMSLRPQTEAPLTISVEPRKKPALIPHIKYIKIYRSIPRKIQKYVLFRQGKISSIEHFVTRSPGIVNPFWSIKKKKYTPKEGSPRWSRNRTNNLLSNVYFSRVSSLSTASGQKTSKGKVVSRKKRSILLIPAVERIEKYTLDRGKARRILKGLWTP